MKSEKHSGNASSSPRKPYSSTERKRRGEAKRKEMTRAGSDSSWSKVVRRLHSSSRCIPVNCGTPRPYVVRNPHDTGRLQGVAGSILRRCAVRFNSIGWSRKCPFACPTSEEFRFSYETPLEMLTSVRFPFPSQSSPERRLVHPPQFSPKRKLPRHSLWIERMATRVVETGGPRDRKSV